eukprot:gene6114-8429_t
MSEFLSKPLSMVSHWVGFGSQTKTKLAYMFNEGCASDENLLSSKGSMLCELTRHGFSVPPGFVLSTECSLQFQQHESKFSPDLTHQIQETISKLELVTGKAFGSIQSGVLPLLLSVRAGSSISPISNLMTENLTPEYALGDSSCEILSILGAPDSWCVLGVKESCLSIGLNDATVNNLAKSVNPQFAYNTYAHFLHRFGSIVYDVDPRLYHKELVDYITKVGRSGKNLTVDDLKNIVAKFKSIHLIPQDPVVQVELAIGAIYKTWFSQEAVQYRTALYDENVDSSNSGVAVIVQGMVFGESGVCFTRDPMTGSQGNGVFGNYWTHGGEKNPLAQMQIENIEVFRTLVSISIKLESILKDMQQFEFVISDDGIVFILNSHKGRRTPSASIKIAVDMVKGRLLTEREALLRVDARAVSDLSVHNIDYDSAVGQEFATGFPCAQGECVGRLVFTSKACCEYSYIGPVILCVNDGTFADFNAIRAASAIITIQGTIMSKVAIMCRGLGKPCICGLRNVKMVSIDNEIWLASQVHNGIVREHDTITINGGGGQLYLGNRLTIPAFQNSSDLEMILNWADKYRKLKIYATIGNPYLFDEISISNCGADGIGCFSTDTLFSMNEDRLILTAKILLNNQFQEDLEQMRNHHLVDIKQFLTLTSNLSPINIKLLDCCLSKFLPTTDTDIFRLASNLEMTVLDIKRCISQLSADSSCLGIRGSRITALYPHITAMQVESILLASLELWRNGCHVVPTILIPSLVNSSELKSVVKLIKETASKVLIEHHAKYQSDEKKISNFYRIGVCIDTPRSCIRVESIAAEVSYLAFNTANLTAHIFGCDEESAKRVFPSYLNSKLYLGDPFRTLDDKAVGKLVGEALKTCREEFTGIQCIVGEGEHTSDARSIQFFNDIGFYGISCNIQKVPIAKICAAQAHIRSISDYIDHYGYDDLDEISLLF